LIPGIDQESTSGGAQDQAILTKLNSSGIMSFNKFVQNRTSPSVWNCSFNSCAVDSLNNVYAVGSTINSVSQSNASFLAKYNSLGAIQWQVLFEKSGISIQEQGIDIDVDPAGNSFVISRYFSSSNSFAFLSKFNLSGTLLWCVSLGVGSSSFGGIISNVLDSSGNVYVLVNDNNSHIIKLNSSGTVVWKKQIAGALGYSSHSLSTNGTNICLCHSLGYIIINSDGFITRQKQIDSNSGVTINGAAFASDGYVYLMGSIGEGGTVGPTRSKVVLIGFNNSDQILYANQMTPDAVALNAQGIAYKNNNLYIAANSNLGANDFWAFNLPASGKIPRLGVYGIAVGTNTYVCRYTRITVASANSTFSITSSTYPVETDTLTTYSGSLTTGDRVWNWGYRAI